jgi:hypothetical protein
MDIKLIREQWADYEKLVSSGTIQQALALPQDLLDEQIDAILPNIELAADGPVVRSLIFFSATYIGEVRLAAGQEDFDVALRDSVANYRINVGQHEVIRNTAAIEQAKSKGEQPPAPEKTVYQKATVKLQHSVFGLITIINYFGENRDDWLKKINTNIPIEILKRSTR